MVASIERTADVVSPDTRIEPVPARPPRDWTWLNWTLALLTPAGAVLVMTYALSAALHAGGCGAAGCPALGASASSFNTLFYGAAMVAAAVLLGSFFTARRPTGIVVPLSGWALLAADLAALSVMFS